MLWRAWIPRSTLSARPSELDSLSLHQVMLFGTGAFHGWPLGSGGGTLRSPEMRGKEKIKLS